MRSRFAMAVVVAVLAIMLCSGATAEQWFDANFDNYTPGDLNGQQGWSGTTGPVRIVPNINGGAGRCVELDCVEFGGIAGGVSHTVTSGNSGAHYVEFYAAMDTALKPGQYYANLAYIQFFSSAGAELTRFYFRGNRFNILLAGADQHLILDNASDRRWHKIGLSFNLLASKLDVKVDDVPVVTGGTLYSSGADIGRISISQWNQSSIYSKSECFVDNLACSSVELPGIGRVALSPRFFPGWQAYNVCYPCVFFDSADSKYKMYYSGTGMGYVNDSTWDQWTTGYVTSADEKKWIFPDNYEAVLFARKYMEGDILNPQTESATFDSIFAYMPWIIKDGSTYKMWYTGWNGDFLQKADHTANKINFRIGYATSPDGINWTKYPGNNNATPVINLGAYGQSDSKGVSHPAVLKKNGTYHMWYEGYDGDTWRIFHTTSINGTDWVTPQLVLSPGAGGALDDKNVRNPVVVERLGRYEMWYQGESNALPKYHVLRATSTDGIVWTKITAQVDLHPATPPRYDPINQPPYDPNDPLAKLIVNTVIPNPDGTCTIYYAKEMTDIRPLRQETVKSRHFFIFREVVEL